MESTGMEQRRAGLGLILLGVVAIFAFMQRGRGGGTATSVAPRNGEQVGPSGSIGTIQVRQVQKVGGGPIDLTIPTNFSTTIDGRLALWRYRMIISVTSQGLPTFGKRLSTVMEMGQKNVATTLQIPTSAASGTYDVRVTLLAALPDASGLPSASFRNVGTGVAFRAVTIGSPTPTVVIRGSVGTVSVAGRHSAHRFGLRG